MRGALSAFSKNALLSFCVMIGDALGHDRRQPAGVIEVRVRVDDIADGLVRNDLPRLRQDRLSARLALPALEHEDVVAELDGESDVPARDTVDAVSHLL